MFIVAAALIVAAGVGFAGTSPPEPERHLQATSRELGTPGLPAPTPPQTPATQTVTFDEFQLVGFTEETFTGNHGILNMSRACQAMYAASRVCEAGEVMKTIAMPEVSSANGQLAWMQTCGHRYPSQGHFPQDGSLETTAEPATDCHGWTTASGRELGMTIDLTASHYGGFMPATCDLELVAACCSKQALIPAE
jgi:hypothetical protein